jgi:hypothetical protein
VNVAVAAALVALLAVAVTHRSQAGSGSGDLGAPIQTMHVNWHDFTRLESQVPEAGQLVTKHGYLETHVTTIEFGRHGWRVHASIVNKSPLPLRVFSLDAVAGTTISYPNQPMSLLVQTDNGGGIKYLKPLAAKSFTPALPPSLKAHSTWAGTFTGSDPVAHGTEFYVGFGQFLYTGSVNSQRGFSTSTAKSAQAP